MTKTTEVENVSSLPPKQEAQFHRFNKIIKNKMIEANKGNIIGKAQ